MAGLGFIDGLKHLPGALETNVLLACAKVADDSKQVADADVGIEIKKGAVDARKIIGFNNPVFPEQNHRHGEQSEPVDAPHLGRDPNKRKKNQRTEMKKA